VNEHINSPHHCLNPRYMYNKPIHDRFVDEQKNCAGFTMLELVVTVALLAIITAAIVPLYANSMNSIHMRNSRANFVSLIAYIQECAVAETREYRLYINTQEQVFWVEYLVEDDAEGKFFEVVQEKYGRLQSFPRYLEVQQVRARQDREARAYYIGCYPNGASDIATVTFRDTRDFQEGFSIKTMGTMGKIEVEVR